MGRVRRNQRDAIRKQRAKRRNRQSGGDESDSDCNQEAVVKRRRVDAEEKQAVSNQADFHSDFVDRSESCKPDVDKPKEKAPVDRIERMRLKKQQQKARNKEKKAARAAAAASKSTSLKNEK
ncbi:hypothetical protein ACHAXN_012824 [Cyclotella atomus]